MHIVCKTVDKLTLCHIEGSGNSPLTVRIHGVLNHHHGACAAVVCDLDLTCGVVNYLVGDTSPLVVGGNYAFFLEFEHSAESGP